jgi:iron-sulfur cluster insertion protein
MLGSITITPQAAAQINKIRDQKGDPALAFRIAVLGGGCSGFQYKLDFDATRNDWDLVFTQDGATVLIDDLSIQFVRDAELDSGCGCGASFAVKMDE